jgi:hypothetical protein
VVELDVPRHSEPVAANATYSIWSLPVTSDPQYSFHTVGAEVDGGGKLLGPHQFFGFNFC